MIKRTIFLILSICFIQLGYAQVKLTEKTIIKTTIVQCSLDTVWWKWTTHEGLLTFFGEDNQMELKPYGPFEICFSKQAPKGQAGSEGCKVLSFIPKRMFSFSWNAPPSHMEARESGYHTCVVVEFKTISDSSTEVTLTHTAWPDDENWTGVYEYFDVAWTKVFEWLGQSCVKE